MIEPTESCLFNYIERPAMQETTGFGAALAAGLAIGVWEDIDTIHDIQDEKADVFEPNWDDSGKVIYMSDCI